MAEFTSYLTMAEFIIQNIAFNISLILSWCVLIVQSVLHVSETCRSCIPIAFWVWCESADSKTLPSWYKHNVCYDQCHLDDLYIC